jgi:CDP-glucose 4,6-dehydratase
MLLYLDSTKAHNRLQWQPVWNFETAIEKTADWYRASLESGEVISRQQLIDYATHAAKIKATWAS